MGSGLTVEFHGVQVIAESELGLCCRVRGRDHWIASDRLLAGSTVAHFGDRGVIIVDRQFAKDRGLVPGRFPLL